MTAMSLDGGGQRNSSRISGKQPLREIEMEQFMDEDVAKEFGLTPDQVDFRGDAGKSKEEYYKRINKRDEFAMAQYEFEIDTLQKKQPSIMRIAPAMVVTKEGAEKRKPKNINVQFKDEGEEEPPEKKQKTESEGLGDLMGDFDLMAPELEDDGNGSGSASASAEPFKVDAEPVKEAPAWGTIAGYASDSDESDDSEPLLNPLA